MPLTFLAHQAPVLPIKRRWPTHTDGVALIVGSMLPDSWYMTVGWLYGPWGIPLWVDGHQLSNVVTTIVIPGTIISFLIRRWMLTDTTRPALWVTASSSLIGGLTHLTLDQFTHWNVAGLPIGQAVSSAVLIAVALVMLQRWWPGWQRRFHPVSPTGWLVMGVGAVVGSMWGLSRADDPLHARFFSVVNVAAIAVIAAAGLSRRATSRGRRSRWRAHGRGRARSSAS